MTAEDLIVEGERLARPCLLLSEDNSSGKLVGVWGGEGIVQPEPGPWKHWITIDFSWLERQGYAFRGLLSVYTSEEHCDAGTVVADAHRRLPRKVASSADLFRPKAWLKQKQWANGPHNSEGIGLYGREARSFPHLDVVFKFGSRAVKTWLESKGFPKPKQPDPYFQIRQEVEPAYEDWWRKREPFFDFSYANAGVLGGWPMCWPEGDWLESQRKRLVLWTFWNSEPWVEVWLKRSGLFELKVRIT